MVERMRGKNPLPSSYTLTTHEAKEPGEISIADAAGDALAVPMHHEDLGATPKATNQPYVDQAAVSPGIHDWASHARPHLNAIGVRE